MYKYSVHKIFLSTLVILGVVFFLFIFYKQGYFTTKKIEQKNQNLFPYKNSIILGGKWFLSNQSKKFLYYEYNVTQKKHSSSSNDLRKLGALWSITKLSKYLNDQKYSKLANQGLKYFEKSFAYDKQYDFYYFNAHPTDIKVGYSAFIILSLIEMEHPKKDEYLSKFANGILHLQQKNGEINPFFYSDSQNGKDYYPGEALTALMSLYSYTKNPTYLEAVKKAMSFYISYFEKNPNLAFIPWQSQAYSSYFEATKEKAAADFVFKMSDYLILANKPKSNCSNYAFPYGTTTAVYLEGVISAYKTAQFVNDNKRIECYGNFINEALKITAAQQIVDSNDKYANGGFVSGTSIKKVRVDRNQHAVMGLMRGSELSL
jgi:hypothetical protein